MSSLCHNCGRTVDWYEHDSVLLCIDNLKAAMAASTERVTEVEGALKACLKFMEGVQFHTSRQAEDFGKLLPYWIAVVSRQETKE